MPIARKAGVISAQNVLPNSDNPTANSSVQVELAEDDKFLTFQVTGTYTGALSVQVERANNSWVTLAGAAALTNVGAATTSATVASGTVGIFRCEVTGCKKARITGLAAMTGSANINAATSL